jgi:hypothetical protein
MKRLLVFINLLCASAVFSQELIPYRNQQLWGYADANGKIVIEPQYEKAFPAWKNGIYKVMKDGNFFLIDAKNTLKTKQGYKQIWEFSNGFAAACKGGEINVMQGEIVGGKWGYLGEKDFSEVIPFDYDRAFDFNGKLAIVQTGGNWGNWGVIDNTGKIIIPFTHPSYSFDMRPFPSIQFLKNGKQLQIDVSGEGNTWIVTDLTGKKISGPVNILHGIYEDPHAKEEAQMKAAEKAKEEKIVKDNYVLRTNKGNFNCSGDLTCIGKGIYITDIKDENKKTFFGLIDENNNVLVPFIYDYVYHIISEGLVKVSRNNFYGFCDLKGNEVVPCRYADAQPFQNGIAKVFLSRSDYSDKSTGYINAKGFEYFKSDPVYQVVTLDGKTQVTDQYFNPVKLPEENITNAEILKNSFILVWDFTKAKLYDLNGNLLVEGTGSEKISEDALLIKDKISNVFNLNEKKITVDSIDHLASKIADPAGDNLIGWSYVHKNGYYGLFNLKGEQVLLPKYTLIVYSGAWFILTDKRGMYAICDEKQNIIKPFSTDHVFLLTKHMFSVQNKNLNEIYDARTKKLSNYKIKSPKNEYAVFASVFANGKNLYGYINKNTEEILEPIYKDFTVLKMFDRNYIPVELVQYKRNDGKFDIYNTVTGKIVATAVEKTGPLQGYWLPVMLDGKYKFIDCNGESKFNDLFDNVKSVRTEGYSAVRKGMKYGLIDRENKTILDYKFSDIVDVVDDFAITSSGSNFYGLRSIINDSVYIPDQYDEIQSVSINQDTNGIMYYFLARKGTKMGVVDQFNHIISPFEFEGIVRFPFTKGGFTLDKNGKAVMFNGTGKCILDNDFDNIELFDGLHADGQEMVLATKGKNVGLYKVDGTLVLPCEYQAVSMAEFYDRYDRVYFIIEKNGKKGILCNTGEITIPVIFDELQPAYSDAVIFCITRIGNKKGLYGDFRRKFADCVYSEIDADEEWSYAYRFIVKNTNGYGMLDTTGKLLIPCEYTSISIAEDDQFLELKRGGKIGLATRNGNMLIPALFDKLEPDYDLGETTWYTYKNNLVGLYRANGTEVVPCQFKSKDYYGEEDGKYILTFIAKNGEKWGLSSTFVFEKMNP